MSIRKKVLATLKGAWNSATIWFNTTGIVLLTVAVADPTVKQLLVEHGALWVLAVGNLILRVKTTQSLEDKAVVRKG